MRCQIVTGKIHKTFGILLNETNVVLFLVQLVECEHLWRCHDLPGVESRVADGVVLAPSDYNQFQGRSAAMHVDPLMSGMRLV